MSPDTRERVLAAVEALGFRRSPTAFALAGGRRRAVTVLASNTTHYGYASVLRGVEEAARAASYSVGIAVLESAEEAAVAAEVRRAADNGGGLIVIAYDPAGCGRWTASRPECRSSRWSRRPRVRPATAGPGCGPTTAARPTTRPGTCSPSAMRPSTTSRSPPAPTAPVRAPAAGGRRSGTRGHRGPVPWTWGGGPAAGHAAGLRLARDPAVTAVLCGNDDLALGVLRALHESGRAVPGEVSVAGFGDAPHAAFLTPELTTVRLDFAGLGRAAFARLHAALEETAPEERVSPHAYPVHEPRLVVRESSGPPPGPAAVRHRLSVDLATSEGPLPHGANGALYGPSDDGVPADAVLALLGITGISQKPEGGAQHPNGDALTVAESRCRWGCRRRPAVRVSPGRAATVAGRPGSRWRCPGRAVICWSCTTPTTTGATTATPPTRTSSRGRRTSRWATAPRCGRPSRTPGAGTTSGRRPSPSTWRRARTR